MSGMIDGSILTPITSTPTSFAAFSYIYSINMHIWGSVSFVLIFSKVLKTVPYMVYASIESIIALTKSRVLMRVGRSL